VWWQTERRALGSGKAKGEKKAKNGGEVRIWGGGTRKEEPKCRGEEVNSS